jgi:predicted Zn finger-like uncharacterized protein
MANMIISCPSCPQKLRVPEELFGRAVKCPKCGATFEAASPAPAVERVETPAAGSEAASTAAPESEGAEKQAEVMLVPDEPRPKKVRRDAEPSRGTLILTMGIVSIVLPVVGWIPGIVAIAMGRTDLKKIKAGQMDRSGADVTQAGWICGIVGACLQGIACIGCGLYITLIAAVVTNLKATGMKPGGPNVNKPAMKQIVPAPPPGPPPGQPGPGEKL